MKTIRFSFKMNLARRIQMVQISIIDVFNASTFILLVLVLLILQLISKLVLQYDLVISIVQALSIIVFYFILQVPEKEISS